VKARLAGYEDMNDANRATTAEVRRTIAARTVVSEFLTLGVGTEPLAEPWFSRGFPYTIKVLSPKDESEFFTHCFAKLEVVAISYPYNSLTYTLFVLKNFRRNFLQI
jgi:hypothetical protein